MSIPAPVAPDLPEGLPDKLQMYVREWMHDPCFDLLPLPRYPEDAAGYPETLCAMWEPPLEAWLGIWHDYRREFANWHDAMMYQPESWHELDLLDIRRLIKKGYRFKHLQSLKPYGVHTHSMHTVIVVATPEMTAQRMKVIQSFAKRFNINLGETGATEEFIRLMQEGKAKPD